MYIAETKMIFMLLLIQKTNCHIFVSKNGIFKALVCKPRVIADYQITSCAVFWYSYMFGLTDVLLKYCLG